MIPFVLLAAVALHDLTALGAQVSDYAGHPVTIDTRLRLPACGHPPIVAPGPSPASIAVECTAPAWHIFVADRARQVTAAPAGKLVSRGDPVSVVAGGPGFRVTVEGVAENDAGAGERLRVRDAATGARLTGVVAADGSVALAGYSSSPPGR